MQTGGILSFLLCALSMFAIFIERSLTGQVLFGLSLLVLAVSLLLSLAEVLLSTDALNMVIDDMAR
jgi:Na+/phosphate symporter